MPSVTQGKLRSQHMLCKRCVMLCLCKRNIIAKSSEITVYLTKMFKLLADAYQGSASLDAAWRLPCPRLHLLVPYMVAPPVVEAKRQHAQQLIPEPDITTDGQRRVVMNGTDRMPVAASISETLINDNITSTDCNLPERNFPVTVPRLNG